MLIPLIGGEITIPGALFQPGESIQRVAPFGLKCYVVEITTTSILWKRLDTPRHGPQSRIHPLS